MDLRRFAEPKKPELVPLPKSANDLVAALWHKIDDREDYPRSLTEIRWLLDVIDAVCKDPPNFTHGPVEWCLKHKLVAPAQGSDLEAERARIEEESRGIRIALNKIRSAYTPDIAAEEADWQSCIEEAISFWEKDHPFRDEDPSPYDRIRKALVALPLSKHTRDSFGDWVRRASTMHLFPKEEVSRYIDIFDRCFWEARRIKDKRTQEAEYRASKTKSF